MTERNPSGPVPRRLVGESGPAARPGDDPALYGSAQLEPVEPVEVRSFRTFLLTYRVGRLGLDDTGAIRVAFRMVSDFGALQTTVPSAPNFVSARCSGSGHLRLAFGPDGTRPWTRTLTARLHGGYLAEGDTITILFGDTSAGSPGWLMQTYAEDAFELRVLVDVQATGHFLPLEDRLAVPVVPGPAVRWRAVLPTLRRPGEPFHLGLKAEDRWGNPTPRARGRVRLEPSLPVAGLPHEFDFRAADGAMLFEGLRVAGEGTLRIRVLLDGEEVAEAGPLVVRDGPVAGFWGDLHGQSGETVGVGTAERYFDFARNRAFLDVAAHQGNDFQITRAFWQRLNAITAATNEPGRFTTFPGYEWSGNTAVGGDHNVFFRTEGRPIRRCSHALLEDRSDLDSDVHTLSELYAALRDEDCVIWAHVGGRYADLSYDHDPLLETAVEVHSAWGTFEWMLTDSLALGRRVGVVAGSDGHKGRPGASHPGASTFGAYGGLTCFLAPENTREAIFEAMRRRHHYATTGCRMHIALEVALPAGGTLFERDPAALPKTRGTEVRRATMGDIVRTTADGVELALAVQAHAGIERVEIRRGAETFATLHPFAAEDIGDRVRVLWTGAEYRGRGRETAWRGRARFAGAEILRFSPINLWNPERLLEPRGTDTVIWDTLTTGNLVGFDVWLAAGADTGVEIATNRGTLRFPLRALGMEERVMEAGGLGRRLLVRRLPEAPLPREMRLRRRIPLLPEGDTAVWVRVVTEDGHQAWTSPTYLCR